MRSLLFSILIIFIFLGCNDIEYVKNVEQNTTTDTVLKKTVTTNFIDDYVNGLAYRCSSGLVDVTKDDGNISCYEDDNVTIYIANTALKPIKISTTPITPYSFFDDINSSINLARLLQSLDTKENKNFITIDKTLESKLPKNIDFSSKTFDEDLNQTISLVSFDEAKSRLNSSLISFGIDVVDINNSVDSNESNKSANKNNHKPVINMVKSINIYENTKEVLTVEAVDDDNDTLLYSLAKDDASYFDINSSTGVLVFKTLPDYEKKNSYNIAVVVSDGYTSVTQDLKIDILNVLDRNILKDTTLYIDENKQVGSEVGYVEFSSLGDINISSISLSSNMSEKFTIDNTGLVKTAVVLDYENIKSYDLNVTLVSQDQSTNSANLKINVRDLPDQKPILVDTVLNVLENAKVGTVVGSLTIQDVGDSNITKIVLSGSDSFSADSNGNIKVLKALDYESINEYNLTAVATNLAGDSTAVNLKIYVNNVLDVVDVLENTSLSVAENTPVGTKIGDINITTNSDSKRLAFNLVGEDSSYFTLTLDGEVKVAKNLDYESKDLYSFVVYSVNEIGESNHINLAISITDVDEAPILEDTNLELKENKISGDIVGSLNIVFSGDTSISDINLTGSGSSNFIVDNSGLVKLSSSAVIDYETTPKYSLKAVATNSIGNSNIVDLNISILDVAYNPFEIFKASSLVSDEYFGYDIDIDSSYIVVSAPFSDSSNAVDTGSIYLYKKANNSDISKLITLKPDDLKSNDNFGLSVAISGNYIVASSPYEDTNQTDSGAVYIFKINSDTNITQIAKIKAPVPQDSAHFGSSVAIDSNYIVVGSDMYDGADTDSGRAYLFKINSDDTISFLKNITPSSEEFNANFGSSVAIDSNYIVVSSPNKDLDNANEGVAYIFKINSDTDIAQIDQISALDAQEDDNFGNSVAIDGAYIVVGAYKEDTTNIDAGSAYIFKLENDSATQIKKIQASNANEAGYFGSSVAISGSYIAVGSYLSGANNSGDTYIFKISNDIVQIDRVEVLSKDNNELFGHSVAIDGDFIAVGAYSKFYILDSEAIEKIYIYNSDNSKSIDEGVVKNLFNIEASSPVSNLTFNIDGDDSSSFEINNSTILNSTKFDYELPTDIDSNNIYSASVVLKDIDNNSKTFNFSVNVLDRYFLNFAQLSNNTTDARFGYSVALSADYVVISKPNLKEVEIYKKGSSSLEYVDKLSSDSEYFGVSVAVDGDYIVVGSLDNKVFVYKISDNFGLFATIDGSSTAVNFGSSVAVDTDYIVVADDKEDSNKGSAYLYKIESSSVSLLTKIDVGESSDDYFAKSIDINANYIVISAPFNDESATDAGAIYLYKIESDDSVSRITKVLASQVSSYDNFGTSVAIYGDYIVAGAINDDVTESNSGAVYIFKTDGSSVNELAKVKSDVAQNNAFFGSSVSITQDIFIVGSSKSNINGKLSIFKINSDDTISYLESFSGVDSSFASALDIDGDNIIVGSYKENVGGGVYFYIKDIN